VCDKFIAVAVLDCRAHSCRWEMRLTFGQNVTAVQAALVASLLLKTWTSVATSFDDWYSSPTRIWSSQKHVWCEVRGIWVVALLMVYYSP